MPKTLEEVLSNYELDAVDQKLMQLVVTYPKMKQQEMADIVGLARSNVSVRMNKQKFKDALTEYYAEPLKIIQDVLRKAARVLAKGLDSPDEKIRVACAKDILISEGVLRNKVDVEHSGFEPIRITYADGTTEIYSDKPVRDLPVGDIN